MKRCFSCFRTHSGTTGFCPYCRAPELLRPKEPVHLVPGTVLARRYVLGQAVGAGGFGIVYRAWDTKLEIVVAVKEFFVSRLVTRAEGLKNLIVTKKSMEEFIYRKDRFLAEARNMAKFGSHRSIPNVFEFFEENNTAYIVMELLNGIALGEYLTQNSGKVHPDFAVMIANEVGNALRSLHEQSIIHRDVAPDNIYICSGKDIRIKLMDLGAAKLADTTDDVIDIILKPGYSPAEQYENSKNIGPWSDVYALGATLYIMLTGIKPDESTNRKIKDTVVYPHLINPAIPQNLSNAVMKAMAVDKHLRFKNVDEFLDAINGGRKIVPLNIEKKRRSLKRLLSISAACLAVVIGGVVAFNMFFKKQAAETLRPADITVWYSVAEGSGEQTAMQSVKDHFESKFKDVNVKLVAIPEDEYQKRLEDAAKEGKLPNLFESSGLSDSVLSKAVDLDNVLSSEQFENAMFLDQYEQYYDNKKQMPLAINVPMAYVITSGASCIDFNAEYFDSPDDFGENVNIACDSEHIGLIEQNFGKQKFCDEAEFLNNEKNTSPVMLSSSMALNEVRTTLTNYEKSFVFYNNDEIRCEFVYEWSMGQGTSAQKKASEKLLSWMLGNIYQDRLMISECQDGQIPVNERCLESKLNSKNLKPIANIYEKFVFYKEEN